MKGLFHEPDYQLDENVQAHFISADRPLAKICDLITDQDQHEKITGCLGQ